MQRLISVLFYTGLCGSLLLAGCSSGSGSRSTRTSPVFGVEAINVQPGASWKINRPIDIEFTEPIDFGTVNLSTISLQDLFGQPATGTFETIGTTGRFVRFSPTCPTQDDFSDAGLSPGTTYRLLILGTNSGGVTIQSTSGEALVESQSVIFNTPDSVDPLALFLDTAAGPPAVRVRGRGVISTTELQATHLETFEVTDAGEVVARQVYFQWDNDLQEAFLEASPFLPQDGMGQPLVPLNLYSQVNTQVSVLVYLDQPVNPSLDNINSALLGFEYEESPNTWVAMPTTVELVENCSETGSLARLTPQGILPQGVGLRVNLQQGFQDITGDPTILDTANFASMEVAVADNPVASGTTAARSADELLEQFLISGGGEGSMEDLGAQFSEPFAEWGEGRLQASFDFGGTGGPGGDFSWIVAAGQTVILDTTTDVITGGPGGVGTSSQTVVNGVIDVVDLTIEAGATLEIQGPNPLTVLASGDVRIDGTILASGGAAPGVGTLNTTNVPEPGGLGQGGGGNGGIGSFLTNQSTPRGGRGIGAFNSVGMGGQGGETSYAIDNKTARRGSGGGGGRFGPDVIHGYNETDGVVPDLDSDPNMLAQALIGLDAEPGFSGGLDGLGAESQTERAQGGNVGPSPFTDGDPENDFLGSKIRRFTVDVNGEPELREELVIGELTRLWAGSGGGGGGDAVNSGSFPLVPFNASGDEKGAGGGGGAGGVRIFSTGDVVIGSAGRIVANGGGGGGGENTNFFDRVGGGSGGGSGGHIVISASGRVELEGAGAGAANNTFWYNDNPAGSRLRSLSALGGQGGAGQDNRGGQDEDGETPWFCDAIPFEAFLDQVTGQEESNTLPLGEACFTALPGVGVNNLGWLDPDLEATTGAGGDGGPGVIQIHVNDPLTDIVFADASVYGQGAAVTRHMAPPPHGWNGPNGRDVSGDTTTVNVPPAYMVPFFNQISRSRSKWFALGRARVNTGSEPVGLQFTGITAGDVNQDGDSVDLGTPLLGPLALGSGNPPFVQGDSMNELVISAGGNLVDEREIYRRNPELLIGLTIRLAEQGNDDNFALFDIEAASYDSVSNRLTLTAAADQAIDLADVPETSELVSVIRRDFRVTTDEVVDMLPAGTGIEIQFQATTADLDGLPSESSASALTGDIDDLNLDPGNPGLYTPPDFIRFQVTFDLDSANSGADLSGTSLPSLDFLRIPFSF